MTISTLEGKRRLIDGFVNSTYLFDDKITITFNFKDGTQTVFLSEIEATKNLDIKSIRGPKAILFNYGIRLFFILNDIEVIFDAN